MMTPEEAKDLARKQRTERYEAMRKRDAKLEAKLLAARQEKDEPTSGRRRLRTTPPNEEVTTNQEG